MHDLNKIDNAVFDGIRKTINRFREKPFHYFTEADIHTTLSTDIMAGSSDILTYRGPGIPSVSLVHQEYPTNFRYIKKKLLGGYLENELDQIKLSFKDGNGKTHGDRGNFDLVILNPEFVKNQIKENKENLHEALMQLINKEMNRASERMKNRHQFNSEILYAIEVKYLHPFNARSKQMIEEIVKDNKKLSLAFLNSHEILRPINLIFCSTEAKNRSDKKPSVISKIKQFVRSGTVDDYKGNSYSISTDVLNIFVESFIHEESGGKNGKITNKPLSSSTPKVKWAKDLKKKIGCISE
jgi:16S rRNA G966 N2-methylase RsmD